MQIHEKLKAARIDNDLTQEKVARSISTTAIQIRRYEKGEQEMTISKLKSLCLLYNVSADYILGLPKGLDWPRMK